MSTASKVAEELQKTLDNQDKSKKQGYDTQATVTRIEGNTAWVEIPGGEDETPVMRTTNANPNDTVMVRVANGTAYLLGNVDNPPTDDKVANAATQLAEGATQMATLASDAAVEAKISAQSAKESAQSAYNDAQIAKAQARDATYYANSALTEMAIVQDVVGTLDWIQKHGSFVVTSDTTVQEGTVYFIYNSETSDYEPIVSPDPTKNPHDEGWYILNVDDSTSAFILAHLAVTTRGLWVLPSGLPSTDQTIDSTVDKASNSDTQAQKQANANARQANDYKVLLSNDGLHVYDDDGVEVSIFGESITFSSNRNQYIGGENAYIVFNQATGIMTIGGSQLNISGNVTIGGQTRSLTQLLADMQSEIDGSIESWYYAGVPTASNLPASNWTTTAQKNQHLRDLYFDTDTGHSYRWALDNNVYKWIEIEDTDATAALALAQQADTKADNAIKTVEYAVGTSSSTAPSSGWSTNSPTWEAGKYVWMRQSKDGVNYTYTCIQGAKGEAGQDGASGAQGPAGPEGLVTVYPTALDITAGTATLAVTLRVNGVITTPTSYSWTKGTETLVLATTSTLNVDDLNAVYNCTVTW